MKKDNKFTRMLNESDQSLSSPADQLSEKERKREEARAQKLALKEEKARQKRIKKFGLVETKALERSDSDEAQIRATMQAAEEASKQALAAEPAALDEQEQAEAATTHVSAEELAAAKQAIPQPVAEAEKDKPNTSHISAEELAAAMPAAQAEIKLKQGAANPAPADETSESKQIEQANQTAELPSGEEQEVAAEQEDEQSSETSAEGQSGEDQKADIEQEAEAADSKEQEAQEQEPSQEPASEEAPEEPVNLLADVGKKKSKKEEKKANRVTYREKEEIDKRLSENPKLSRVDDDEIARLKREIALERGIISPEDVAAAEENKSSSATKGEQNEATSEDPKNANLSENNENSASEEPNEGKKAKEENTDEVPEFTAKNTKNEKFTPPDVSQPDNITNEDIQQIMAEREEEERLNELKEEEESYKGMTEEEIADAKQRRKKFAELKQRYNSSQAQEAGDAGDYKKSLDFSVNTSIKQFRVKPPKKPFIITAIVLTIALIVSALVSYFIINAPAPPVVLKSIALTQEYTYQYVDERVNFTGVYVVKTYSDSTTEQVPITYDMVVARSENIDQDFNITSFLNPTFVRIEVEDKTVDLKITLTDIVPEELTVQLPASDYKVGDTIAFDDILMRLKVRLGSGVIFEETQMRFNAKDAAAYVSGTEVTKTDDGFVLSSSLFSAGENSIEFRLSYRSLEFRCIVHLTLTAAE